MTNVRLHIVGASGSGTTTLGRAIAGEVGIPCYDTDSFYWYKTDPPFVLKRPVLERIHLLEPLLAGDSWVLSGSLCGWGDGFVSCFTHVVFLRLENTIRLERLRQREYERYGERIHSDMKQTHEDFMAWCNLYETAGTEVRSLVLHRAWLQKLSCPVLELRSEQKVEELCRQIKTWISTGEAVC
jgi:adenylate kinase family enzyme